MANPKPCSVLVALESEPEHVRKRLVELIDEGRVPKAQLARMLQKHGHPVSGWSLRHHARKDCSCVDRG